MSLEANSLKQLLASLLAKGFQLEARDCLLLLQFQLEARGCLLLLQFMLDLKEIRMPVRRAFATWKGGLKDGNGTFKTESGLSATYNFGSRFGEEVASNPEELLAAAEAACFSMALSGVLEKNGTPGKSVQSSAKCTVEKVGDGFSITSIVLDVRVAAAGLDDATLQRLANETKTGCPVARVLTGTRIEVKASLA